MLRATRIAYNSQEWRKPTGEAAEQEAETYSAKFGFGHEDWLFRAEWLIDGWRYSFVEGVNRSHKKLAEAKLPFDLDLYTIETDKRRRYIARIEDIEVLNDEEAERALEEFKKLGWFDQMRADVADVGGKPEALGSPEFARHILNVRFKLENVIKYPPGTYAAPSDPVNKWNRYLLYDVPENKDASNTSQSKMPDGSASVANAEAQWRSPTPAVLCTPEERIMQTRLLEDLKSKYPPECVKAEDRYIDISVRTDEELILFELKSDLSPRSVIRQALGQLLEYAYYPSREHPPLPIRLVIVGRRELTQQDRAYLDRLRRNFSLPIEYRVVSV